ncbi:glycosyltransferase [Pseudolysobacter antarcticus]|uniref:Glycosyltransferase n=1 Tax=Pseudolysobacter antarcticus TaxID=2511995 RepID=A0A411HN04_9GAMM|nr:glycosyltransferase [Pseudolysobacter antarcticus]QBB71850.1 glycosyltransferase [Pseudolysobacter antarcticus]
MNVNTNQILLLGMHRSGTSAIARVIGLMGAWIGEEHALLAQHPTDNPTGYWERQDVTLAHHDFLLATGNHWDTLANFRAEATPIAAQTQLRDRLRPIVAELDAHPPWLLKDPRLCLLLPLWQSLLQSPVHVIAVRNPGEVAASLLHGPRGAYSTHFLLALWEKYLLSTLTALRGKTALFVSYERLLTDPLSECTRIFVALRDLGVAGLHAADQQQVQAFIDTNLHRSHAISHTPLSTQQAALHAWLEVQTAANGAVQVEDFPINDGIDAVLAEYEIAIRHARAQANAEAQRNAIVETTNQKKQLAQLQADISSVHDLQLTQLHAEFARQQELTAQLLMDEKLRHEERQHRIAQALAGEQQQRRRADLGDAHHANLQSQIAQLSSHIQTLQGGIHAMQNSLAWRLSAPLRKLGELLPLRLSYATEQQLYRSFYALSGVSPARKRALVLWLHRRAPWLTRNTLSYQLYQKTREIRQPSANVNAVPRMDNTRAETIINALPSRPLISIVMPVYNVERRWLLLAVESVQRQFYPHWELCIADDASTNADTRAALREIAALGDKRIRMVKLKKNLGIAGCSNAALKLASGEYIGLLDNDDELTRDALLEVAQRIVAEQPDVIYSDEDKLEENGAHVEVHCKSDYNPDYFFSINYICHFAVIRRAHLASIGDFRDGFDGAQDYDLLLRATERSDRIVHIPKVLYHWRKIEGSTASTSTAKPKTTEAGKNALIESMQRRGIDCAVELGPYPNTFRVRRTILGNPLVSILIPFREQPKLLDACVSSILEKTRYQNFEILCIDNGSVEPATLATIGSLQQRDPRVRVLRYDAPFNYSAINNFGVTHARGEHILLLNNDTEVIGEEWLDSMLEHSQRPEVGVVGARLLYEDGTIQHAGVLVGPGGVAGHAHLFLPGDHPGYFARAQLVQNLSAVTFACAMTRRDVFEQLGGLNENELKIAFNDVDYCLRVREAGYLIVYTPYALLHHYESKSRGYEDTPEKQARFSNEVRYMQKRHAAILERGDPYYNPQLSLSNTFHPDAGYAQELP